MPASLHARPRVLALAPALLGQRLLEIIPGLVSWTTLIGLVTLALARPFLTAVFLILYDFYWLVRALYTGVHLIASYRMLRRIRGTDWAYRLSLLDNPTHALSCVAAHIRDLERQQALAATRPARKRVQTTLWQERRFQADLRRLQTLPADRAAAGAPLSWRDVLHVVILPTSHEPLSLLEQSVEALAHARYPKERLWVVIALEERAGEHAHHVRRALAERYADTFGLFLTTLHPDGIAGERKVKSANASYAARAIQPLLAAAEIPYEHVIVSNLDADSVVAPDYFAALTYAYLSTPDRLRCSYQPLPLYANNIWDAPAFTRVVAMNATFWVLIQSVRPERLVTYSSQAIPLQALVDVGFWDPTVVSEDSRIFWQCYVHYDGRYRVVPLFTTVSMDVTRAPTHVQSIVHQYKQIRRWAWGIENFPFVARALFFRPTAIPLRQRLHRLWVMIEAWHSWATSSLILVGLGWILILFGGTEFQQTILAFNLPRVTRTLLTIGMTGLALNATLSLLLVPPPPPGTPKRRYLWMVLQWSLTPLIASVFGSLPALDAQTRLMFGKYLGFWVTPKIRPARDRAVAHPATVQVRAG